MRQPSERLTSRKHKCISVNIFVIGQTSLCYVLCAAKCYQNVGKAAHAAASRVEETAAHLPDRVRQGTPRRRLSRSESIRAECGAHHNAGRSPRPPRDPCIQHPQYRQSQEHHRRGRPVSIGDGNGRRAPDGCGNERTMGLWLPQPSGRRQAGRGAGVSMTSAGRARRWRRS